MKPFYFWNLASIKYINNMIECEMFKIWVPEELQFANPFELGLEISFFRTSNVKNYNVKVSKKLNLTL